VKPPIAANSKPQKDGSGRIVVNVRDDGTFTAEDFNTILPGEDEIYDMVKTMKERHRIAGRGLQAAPSWRQGRGLPYTAGPPSAPPPAPESIKSSSACSSGNPEPQTLHLTPWPATANSKPMKRISRLDISSLIDVCFLLLIYFLVTSTIKPRETDLGMALPAANPSNEQPDIEPLLHPDRGHGSDFHGCRNRPSSRWIPTSACGICRCCAASWTLYASAARAANSKPLVQIYADGGQPSNG
jgi:biopolymer transport protein ExbD